MKRNLQSSALILASLVFVLALTAGCGDGGETEQAADADKAEGAVEVAVHDCDGGCGMKDVAVDQMTVADGKYYCAGCAKKAEGEDHSGHDHK